MTKHRPASYCYYCVCISAYSQARSFDEGALWWLLPVAHFSTRACRYSRMAFDSFCISSDIWIVSFLTLLLFSVFLVRLTRDGREDPGASWDA